MIILLYGKDLLSSGRKLANIKTQFNKKSGRLGDLTDVGAETLTFENLSAILLRAQLIPTSQLVIIRNFFAHHGGRQIEKNILPVLKQAESDRVIVFYEEADINPTPLFKILNQPKLAQRFALPESRTEARNWIKREVLKNGAKIDDTSALLLYDLIGPDFPRLSNEITKLAMYDSVIEVATVKRLVRGSGSLKVFALLDALADKNMFLAYKNLRVLLGQGEHPLALFSLLTKQIENLLKIKDLKNRGANETEIASSTKVHPYVIKKSVSALSYFSLGELIDGIRYLSRLDLEIRRGATDPETALERFIIK